MKEGWLYIMVECFRCVANMTIMISSQDGILLYIDNWYIYGVLLRYMDFCRIDHFILPNSFTMSMHAHM